MFREFGSAFYPSEVKTTGIVVLHRKFVVGIVVVDKHHAFYAVALAVEGAKNIYQILRYAFVAHHLAKLYLPFSIIVE